MATLLTTPAGWYADPKHSHDYRYWDGYGWTDHVADAGVASTDPLTPPTRPTATYPPSPPASQPWSPQPSAPTSQAPNAREGVGAYVGNLALCLVFPFVILWFGPKYVFKKDYGKALGVLAVLIVDILLIAWWKSL